MNPDSQMAQAPTHDSLAPLRIHLLKIAKTPSSKLLLDIST
jgi:hypothetical protein